MRSGKKFTTVFLPAVICLLSLLVAACGTGGSTPGTTTTGPTKAATDKQVYVYPYAGLSKIKTLDPAVVSDLYSSQSIIMVYNGLVELDDKGNIVPALAKSWTPGDGG